MTAERTIGQIIDALAPDVTPSGLACAENATMAIVIFAGRLQHMPALGSSVVIPAGEMSTLEELGLLEYAKSSLVDREHVRREIDRHLTAQPPAAGTGTT